MANAIEEYRKKFGTKNKVETPSAIEQYRASLGVKKKVSGKDLKTSAGLAAKAEQAGLGEEAKRITSTGDSFSFFS